MPFQALASYMLAMGGIQALNHLMSRGELRRAYDQRAAFHSEQMMRDDRRTRLQEMQIEQAERARIEEFAQRNFQQLRGQSLDHERHNWPLTNTPENYEALGRRPGNMVIALIPPIVPSGWPGREIAQLYDRAVGDMLGLHYGANDLHRPVTFLGNGWQRDSTRSESALEMLYHRAPEVPVALIQVDYFDGGLHLMVGCSGLAPDLPGCLPMFSKSGRVSFLEPTAEAARREVETFKNALQALKEGKLVDPSALGVVPGNAALCDLEAASQTNLEPMFRLSTSHMLDGARLLIPALRVVAAGLADFYHWNRAATVPKLPDLLPELTDGLPRPLMSELTIKALEQYEAAYTICAERAPGIDAANRLLRLAKALSAPALVEYRPDAAGALLDAAIDHVLVGSGAPAGIEFCEWVERSGAYANRTTLLMIAEVMAAIGRSQEAERLLKALPRSQRINTARPGRGTANHDEGDAV